MGLESVKKDILRNAQERASSLIAEARKEADRIIRQAQEKTKANREKAEAETRKSLEVLRRQKLAAADLESRKMVLEAKKQVIETALNEARKQFESMTDKKKESFMKKLLDKVKMEVDVEYIYCNPKDGKLVKGYTVNPLDIRGGLIAENKEKNIRIDYSFEVLLDRIRETELMNLNQMLFG